MPLLQSVTQRLGFRDLLLRYIPPHGNEKVAAVDSLLLLVFNITSGRQPLYELAHWTTEFDGRLFGWASELSEMLFNDDRYGRALDKLYEVDRASLMTDLVLKVVQATELLRRSTTTPRASRQPAGCWARHAPASALHAGIARIIGPT